MQELINIRFDSAKWRNADVYNIAKCFIDIGFQNVHEVMDLRVYDLLNMNRIDNNRAEEMLVCLYKLLNNNPTVDEGMKTGEIEQPFGFARWSKVHGTSPRIKVKDIILAEEMNLKALYRIFDRVTRAFYNSDEYNSRNYRYLDFDDYKKNQKGA